MSLPELWFLLVAVLWTGFLVLEGFDFGVGMLHGVVGRDDEGRRVALGTVGSVWDANEVWLVVAAAAMFAAFPDWYATMFSGFYPALLVLLVALIVRGVAFEFSGRRDDPRWRHRWQVATTTASLLAPLLLGIALGNLLHGVPIDGDGEYAGDLGDLLGAYALLTGATLVLLCLLHGSTFLALRTSGDVRERAVMAGRRIAPLTVLAVLAFTGWTFAAEDAGVLSVLAEAVAVLGVLAAWRLLHAGRDGRAFTASAITVAAVVLTVFTELYPRVMVSSLGAANDLTVEGTAASSYALTVMTVVAVVFLPLVLAYQAWSYHVFRRRLGRERRPAAGPPRPRKASDRTADTPASDSPATDDRPSKDTP
ncbi:MAG: cytochrome d ubiquinol oxidase subunit II [Actinomycetes bacterium]